MKQSAAQAASALPAQADTNTMNSPKEALRINVYRGDTIECSHQVHAIAVNKDGHILEVWGDPQRLINPRSSIKPIQAFPFAESGAMESFNLGTEELAMACSSHNIEPIHVDIVTRWLDKLGLDTDILQCGHHYPHIEEDAHKLIRENASLDNRYNNCSGKHMGMISACKQLGYDLKTYTERSHPLQKRIFEFLSELTDYDVTNGHSGTDGCSIPTPAIPLENLARGYARYTNMDGTPQTILDAMANYPLLIAGNKQLDTAINAASEGRIITKKGAEGNCWAFIRDQKITLYLKTEDGDAPDRRADNTAIGDLLRHFDALDTVTDQAISSFTRPVLRNWKGLEIGKTETVGL